ncbi:MAG: 3-phosphoshikimate 1-carboxyvinyltransferase [Chloroflexota bacterium]|nr:MAG: 3-phosphoshikimate 1-carboxyvinyltransferase [Chloroflexota bacterium]
MADVVEIIPLDRPLDAVARVPGSKSMTNRALILAALVDGPVTIAHALTSDDTDRMVDCLQRLGFDVSSDSATETMSVVGLGRRIPAARADLMVGASGTCARFLTALVGLGSGVYTIDGVPRMRERPIEPLLAAIRDLGARATSVNGTGCPPARVSGGPMRGGEATMDASISSQFVSALLMVAPVTERGVTLRLTGAIVSRPYIDMTLRQMGRAGATAEWRGESEIVVPGGQRYRAGSWEMESDASNASYFFAAAAILGGTVRVPALPADSIQGDLRFLEVLERIGAVVTREGDTVTVRGPTELRGIDVDANAFPDVAQTIAAIAPFASGPTTVRNVASMRVKETDRVAAVVAELRRLGQDVEEGPDWFRVSPRPIRPATIKTYDDHRMAMAFSLIGLRAPGVRIADPGCVAKTFPGYFDALRSLGVTVRELDTART